MVFSLSRLLCLCNNSDHTIMTMGDSYRGLGRSRVQLLSLSIFGLANAAVNNDASPYEIKFNDTASVGPDGECRVDAV